MALLAATAARRASLLIRPAAAAALIRRMCSSASFIRALRAEADSLLVEGPSLQAKAAAYRVRADTVCASTHGSEVLRIIESAMQSDDHSLVEDIPSDFPFKISKTDGLNDITFRRSFKGEQIEVVLSMPALDHEEEDSTSSSSSDGYSSYSYRYSSSSDENREDKADNRPQEYTVPLTVTVSKDDGSSLEFDCTAYPDKIVIGFLFMRQKEDGEEYNKDAPIASDKVLEFSELDAKLQQALHKYLELRSITPMNTKILHEHMISKDRRR